jgi:nitric oxide reductase NorD protein
MDAAAQLTRLHGPTGERYVRVHARIATANPKDRVADWAQTTLALASRGWHAWECADAFLALTESECDQGNDDLAFVLERGRFAVTLSNYTFEPASLYLQSVRAMRVAERAPAIAAIDALFSEVTNRFPQASALIVGTLRAAFAFAAENRVDEVQVWARLASGLTRDRRRLDDYLAVTIDCGGVDWHRVAALSSESHSHALYYLQHYPQIRDSGFPRGLTDLFETWHGDAGEVVWLPPTLAALRQCPRDDGGRLLKCLMRLPGPRVAVAMLSVIDRLPMSQPGLVDAWIDEGLRVTEDNPHAGDAWFSFISVGSLDCLAGLRGQIDLIDYLRPLQLYTEGFTGERLHLESLPAAASADPMRLLPLLSGGVVQLPERVNRFTDRARNFSLLKMSLLHQLGVFEFKTTSFAYGDSRDPFSAFFATFADPDLAQTLFRICEDARIDWQILRHLRGARSELAWLMQDALGSREPSGEGVSAWLECMVRFSLGAGLGDLRDAVLADGLLAPLLEALGGLDTDTASVADTAAVVEACYRLLLPVSDDLDIEVAPVLFRGEMDLDDLALQTRIRNIEMDLKESLDEEETFSLSDMVNAENVTIEEMKEGAVSDSMGMFLTDLEEQLDAEDGDPAKALAEGREGGQVIDGPPLAEYDGHIFQYDEWDYQINDYRRRWCTLFEITETERDAAYFDDTLTEFANVAANVRGQLNRVRPEMLRKVKGVTDGEELDLEKAVEAIVDRRSGWTPGEAIYVQRQRKDRDVSALFLLDMSASTDDRIPDPDAPPLPKWDEDEDEEAFLANFYDKVEAARSGTRIIDLEKQAVILMANALEGLGDSYSICGFSGYGRERVDYFLCKDFSESLNENVKGRIGAIKPCRSTRMGPPIRHAVRSLAATESRVKALIIISDGYPQDHDYGSDRNSREYGIRDTTMALTEARRQGIQTFCLTVDQSGHDYLREMCPDQQYMVMREIKQLPQELTKVYRSLTG